MAAIRRVRMLALMSGCLALLLGEVSSGSLYAAITATTGKNAQLNDALEWAKTVAATKVDGDLVVPIEVIRNQLGFTSDPAHPKKGSVVEATPQKLVDAKTLAKAVTDLTNEHKEDTDPDTFIKIWNTVKAKYLSELDTVQGNEEDAIAAWKQFLDDWQTDAATRDKARFRAALMQLPIIAAGLLLGFEKEHIAAAIAGAVARTSGSSGAGSGGTGSSYRPTHLTIHHTRKMNWITERHARRMARIVY